MASGSITTAELRRRLSEPGEVAIVDAREEGSFFASHLLMASSLPLSRLELLAPPLLPRRAVRVVVCDDGEGLAERAAARLAEGGYGDVAVLEGGIKAWAEAGYPLYSGVHVPSKAFAEIVEHQCGTPSLGAEELAALQRSGEKIAIFDSRTFEEYHSNSIPGATSVPGAELLYRFADLVPAADTLVVVNCGGRTRSIIGAQALIDAGVPNPVRSLKNGTMGWHLAGFEVARGASRRAPAVSPQGLALARERAQRVARRFGVPMIDGRTLDEWRREADRRTLYLLDVREPEEYRAGHLPGSLSAPGGQLVQETDNWLGVWGARVVLVDREGVRAPMTAAWLRRMGWDAVVLEEGFAGAALEEGFPAPDAARFALAGPEPQILAPADLAAAMRRTPSAVVVDLALSTRHRAGHIPGAWFAIRARLASALGKLPGEGDLVFTSEEGTLARFAAAEIGKAHGRRPAVLAGGTAAWREAGLPLDEGMGPLASEPDDVALSARDRPPEERERRMREYLEWEIGLAERIAHDADCRFRVAPPRG